MSSLRRRPGPYARVRCDQCGRSLGRNWLVRHKRDICGRKTAPTNQRPKAVEIDDGLVAAVVRARTRLAEVCARSADSTMTLAEVGQAHFAEDAATRLLADTVLRQLGAIL